MFSKKSEILWVQAIQHKYFPELFELLKNPKAKVSSNSRSLFSQFAIFLDPELQILRCTTRNEKTFADYGSIYPILLPSMVKNNEGKWTMCEFTRLLVKKRHVDIAHQGVPNTLANLRSEFWILKGRSFVQKVLKTCVICKKVQGPFFSVPAEPELPEFRVIRSRPFTATGCDYLGHFWCKELKGSKYKVWYIMFTCGSTRAIHLEAVKSRSTGHFINAISRFMNWRGIPKTMISDHEGSFKRLSEELEEIAKSKRAHKFIIYR